ncbi:MAG TPA: hypothetical protein VEU08_23075 [Vicinamibacterales bacterium]|nr:hypothetical protein [Vicinamibacterales bacterium]
MFILAALMLGGVAFAPACTPTSGDAHDILRRVAERVGLSAAGSRLLHTRGFDVVSNDYQSDRMYPPYISSVSSFDSWFVPATGVERTSSQTSIAGLSLGDGTTIGSTRASYLLRDTVLTPSDQVHSSLFATRPLNVWALLDDWLASTDATVVERCEYRDYPRIVLRRSGGQGPERLFVDEKTSFPVKLDRVEPHYLWGQVHAEYVYSTWRRLGDVYVPGVSFRMMDGRTTIERTFGPTALTGSDSAPAARVPESAPAMGYPLPPFLEPTNPDTVRVSGNTFLLKNRGYTEMVSLARDTVFVFDASQGEARAREDSAWIGKLFPGPHPIAVIVTDLAWPHVSGVRFWVARGATIIAHRAARSFLQSVVDRRWTLAPDLLEKRRRPMRFVGVNSTSKLAGGALMLFPIDGIGSEVALAAYVANDRFLWASDYVQNLNAPTLYVDEVVRAVRRVGITPERAAAQHMRLVGWDTVARLGQPR